MTPSWPHDAILHAWWVQPGRLPAGVDSIVDPTEAGERSWGGRGRTGTVVGARLIAEEGLGYPGVPERIEVLRAGTRKSHEPAAENDRQRGVLRRLATRQEAA